MPIHAGGPRSIAPLARRAGAWVSVTVLLVASCMVYDADLLTETTHQDGTGATDSVGASGGVPQEGGATGTGGIAPRGGTTSGGTGAQGGSSPTGGGSGGSATGAGGSGSGGEATGGTSTTQGGSSTTTGGGGASGGPSVMAGEGPGGSPVIPEGGTAGEAGAGGEAGTGGCPNGDCCPTDPLKTDEGECGCGTPDDDSDSDGTPDCNDQCPDSPRKTAPGQCGCDILDNDMVGEAGCLGLKAALVHRYSFDGNGTVVADSEGSADGTVVGTTLNGSGALTLAGGTSDRYVNLPNGLIKSLTNATVEIWLTWAGGDDWQRIFDFGSNTNGEDAQGNGQTYLFVTCQSGIGQLLSGAFSINGNGANETRTDADAALPSGAETHVAFVVDDTNNRLSLYLNGAVAGTPADFSGKHLSGLSDVNNWIGRSQWQVDPSLGGEVDEFRIYNAALTDDQIALSASSGPDPAFLP